MKDSVDFSKLINDAINGNAAFEELYQLTSKSAYQTASLLLKNHEDIEDVLQNSYIKAYQKLPELKNPESFESWIKTIVENECKNYIKKEKRISAPILFFKNKTDEHSEEWEQPVPQEYMEREELRKNISDIIDSLSPEVRACIVLFHYEDKSLNEISEILDIPLGTVKSRLYNGRKQIEKEFNKLKKKDPTLYAVGAIPVVLSLLAYQAKNIVVPAAVSESIIASVTSAISTGLTSATGTATALSTAAGTSAATAAASTTATIAAKVTAVAVAGSVAVGGTVAVKTHIDNKAAETSTTLSETYISEETCTVAEVLTENSTTKQETQALITSGTATVSATSLRNTTQSSTATRTTRPTTKSTTKRRTTTARSTTVRETTTKKVTSTAPATTLPPPTTSPENLYGSSGGVITEYTGNDTSVSIPSTIGSDTVTAIGSGAFAGNTDIKSVYLPSSVTQIGQEAFADCTSLTSVSLPSSLEHIGIGAFYGCTNLSSVSVPNGTKSIGDEAFADCTSLNTVTIPSSVTSISDDAFYGCDSLTIRCTEGSAAHEFAAENNINFILI